jgi:hypothetical protein
MIDPRCNLPARHRIRLILVLILTILILVSLTFGLRAMSATVCLGPC